MATIQIDPYAVLLSDISDDAKLFFFAMFHDPDIETIHRCINLPVSRLDAVARLGTMPAVTLSCF